MPQRQTVTNVVSAALRIVFALIGAFVVVALIVGGGFKEFATFTLQSNLMMAISFAWTAVTLLGRWRTPPEWLAGSAVFYIAITGLVYRLVLRPDDFPLAGSFFGWFASLNNIEHILTPIGAFVIWLVFAEHRRVAWKYVWGWLVYLVAYVAVILTLVAVIPGAEAPYPFLSTAINGIGGVAWRVVVFFVGFAGLAALLILLDHVLPARTRLSEFDPRDPANQKR